MFVIVNEEGNALGKYFKSTYIVQGEYYICFDDDISVAKKYSSLNRAKIGLEKLYDKVGVIYDLDIEEVKQ